MTSFDAIKALLAGHRQPQLPAGSWTHAAVALILRAAPGGPEVLFIERSPHDGDPWSGDLGFPGGKVEAGDRDERQAAERETSEEIGVNLLHDDYLGQLDDIIGAHLPVRVSCFVYGLTNHRPLKLSEEVRQAFWVPLAQLYEAERHIQAPVRFQGERLVRPAIRILQPGQPVLWGITYRLVLQFLQLLGHTIPPPSPGK